MGGWGGGRKCQARRGKQQQKKMEPGTLAPIGWVHGAGRRHGALKR